MKQAVLAILIIILNMSAIHTQLLSRTNTEYITQNNGTLRLSEIGAVIFSTKTALLHFQIDPVTMITNAQNAIRKYVNQTTLLRTDVDTGIPLLKQLLIMEINKAQTHMIEYKSLLENLLGITATSRNKRMAGILGLGLSIFNAGWSAYLTTQVYDISKTTAKNTYVIGELRKHLKIQEDHIITLAKSMMQFEATTYATTEMLASIKIISAP